MKTKTILQLSLAILGLTATTLHAQVAINNSALTPNASAILDLNTGNAGVNKGFLPPQVSLTNINAAAPVVAPATGLIVYNTNAGMVGGVVGYYYWNGAAWASLAVGGGAVSGGGTTNFLARWTGASSLGNGMVQDNATTVGINNAPIGGTMLTVTGGINNNGINGTTADVNTGSYGVRGTDSANTIGYLGYKGLINVLGQQIYSSAGYFTATGVNGALTAVCLGNNNDPAVIGLSNIGHGGFFTTSATYATGIIGENLTADAGDVGQGLEGETKQTNGFGVRGVNFNPSSGIGVGIYGVGSGGAGNFFAGPGIMGDGVNFGVAGICDAPAATLNTGAGYFQDLGGDFGLIGDNMDGAGGYFADAGGDLTYLAMAPYGLFTTSTKSTMVLDENNKERMMFCDESPEVIFHDYATATLSNGKVHINLDPLFAKTVAINEKHPLRVMVTLNDQCNGVYVTNRTATGFDVVELNNGTSNASFTYEVIANRADTKTFKGEARNYADWRYPVGPNLNKMKPILHHSDVKNTKLLSSQPTATK